MPPAKSRFLYMFFTVLQGLGFLCKAGLFILTEINLLSQGFFQLLLPGHHFRVVGTLVSTPIFWGFVAISILGFLGKTYVDIENPPTNSWLLWVLFIWIALSFFIPQSWLPATTWGYTLTLSIFLIATLGLAQAVTIAPHPITRVFGWITSVATIGLFIVGIFLFYSLPSSTKGAIVARNSMSSPRDVMLALNALDISEGVRGQGNNYVGTGQPCTSVDTNCSVTLAGVSIENIVDSLRLPKPIAEPNWRIVNLADGTTVYGTVVRQDLGLAIVPEPSGVSLTAFVVSR